MSAITFMPFSAAVLNNLHPTNFGIYDNDPQFASDANSLVYMVQRAVGGEVLESEVGLLTIWAEFESSVLEYSDTINRHHARNILLDLLGYTTGSLSGSENSLPYSLSTNAARRFTLEYAFETQVNSPWTTYTGSIRLIPGQQNYDLLSYITGTHPTFNAGNIQIRKIHHYNPVTTYRFFDSQSFINYIGNEFNFASYSPETVYYLLPVWEDILRGTMLEQQANVRRSNYSFDIRGFMLRIYPVPIRDLNLFFEYTTTPDPLNPWNSPSGSAGAGTTGITSNLSNVAFGFLNYSGINSMGKTWIYNMTVARCKLVLSNIRSKYGSLPIPNGEVQLNGAQLEAQSQREMENLRQELKETLESLSYTSLMKDRSDRQDLAIREWNRLPKFVYRSK